MPSSARRTLSGINQALTEVITNDYPEALILFPTDLTCPQSHVYNVGPLETGRSPPYDPS
jgi:hypothetical protein